MASTSTTTDLASRLWSPRLWNGFDNVWRPPVKPGRDCWTGFACAHLCEVTIPRHIARVPVQFVRLHIETRHTIREATSGATLVHNRSIVTDSQLEAQCESGF